MKGGRAFRWLRCLLRSRACAKSGSGGCSRIVYGNARRGLDDMQQWSVTVRVILEGNLPGQRLGKKEEEKVWA